MRGPRPVAAVVLVLAGAVAFVPGLAGCARARAVTPRELPPLAAPPPPPHVVVIADEPAEPPPAAPPGEAASPAPPEPERPVRVRRPPPATPSSEPAQEPEPAAAGDEPAARALQTPDSGADAERRIRNELARAGNRLHEVDYAALSPDLKGQYEVAERFIRQAHEALGARNLVFAETLADKAAEIADALPGR